MHTITIGLLVVACLIALLALLPDFTADDFEDLD